jgi:hypothetical protein
VGEKTGSIFELVRDDEQYPLEKIFDAAETATRRNDLGFDTVVAMLASDTPAVRYWGTVGLRLLAGEANQAEEQLRKLADDDEWPSVRIAAAEALIHYGQVDAGLKVLGNELSGKDEWTALRAANVLEVIGDDARPALPQLREAAKSGGEYVQRAAQHTAAKLSQ